MKADSGREGRLVRNPDVRAEFEKIMKDPNQVRFWKNYIRGRLIGSLISQYERNTTEDDIFGRLEIKIYDRGMEWNRDVYKTFQHFMFGKIQNIIRNKEASLKIRYEKYLESENVEYLARPTTHPETARESIKINIDRIEEGLVEGEDKYGYYSSKPKKAIDKDKFHEEVYGILNNVKDTDCLIIFTSLMDGKGCREIRKEYGMTSTEYVNAYRRLKRKLREHLPVEYSEMFKE
jgi:hypothetical protein